MTAQPGPGARLIERLRMSVHRAGFEVRRESFKRRFVRGIVAHGIDQVLDIGANAGQFADALRDAGFTGRIVSVEPLGHAYDVLARAAAADPARDAVRAAVAAEAGTVTMNVSQNSVSSSVLPMAALHSDAAPSSAYVGTEDVRAVTVDALVAEHGLDPARTLLKIDVQGYEKAVLDGATRTLGRFAGVRTEMSLVPLYEGQVLLLEILQILDRHGFDLWLIEEGFKDPGTGRLLQMDGVFFSRDVPGTGDRARG